METIFPQHALPLGELQHRGSTAELQAIHKTALLAVDGAKDDICTVGQTLAAQELCCGLWPYRKPHHMQAGVGHDGVFSHKRWQNQIHPILRNMILSND